MTIYYMMINSVMSNSAAINAHELEASALREQGTGLWRWHSHSRSNTTYEQICSDRNRRRGAQVLRVHVVRQMTRPRERSGAVEACVIPALLVHRTHVHRQVDRRAERSVAVGARVVPALLVHRVHM